MSDAKQILYVNTFVGLIADNQAPSYNVAADQIRAWFRERKGATNVSEGYTMVLAGKTSCLPAGKNGAGDLSEFYIEDVVQWAIDMKFRIHFPS